MGLGGIRRLPDGSVELVTLVGDWYVGLAVLWALSFLFPGGLEGWAAVASIVASLAVATAVVLWTLLMSPRRRIVFDAKDRVLRASLVARRRETQRWELPFDELTEVVVVPQLGALHAGDGVLCPPSKMDAGSSLG